MSASLNLKTLAALREIEKPGQLAFTTKLINAFLEDAEKKLLEVQAAHASGNPAQLAKLAHAIKGTSLNVGADGFAAAMLAIEREAEKGGLCAPERLSGAEALFRETRVALLAYLG